MARFNFYLKNVKAKRTSVILSITYESNQCRYYTGISIEPNKWNTRKQEIKSQVEQSFLINKSLNNIKSVSESCYYDLVNSGTHINNDILKERINEQLTPTPILNFYSFADEFLNDNKQYKKTTLTDYKRTISLIKEFEESKKYKITFDSITMRFYDKFKAFIMGDLSQSTNTFGKRIKILKTLLKASYDRGHHTNNIFDNKGFKKLEKVKKKVYLTKDEVKLIENVELIPRLDRVRDCFLLMCYLGLRISDLKSVNKSNIDGENQKTLHIQMYKNEGFLSISIIPQALSIIEKYDYKLPIISESKMNKYIKEVGEIAGINDLFMEDEFAYKKFEKISNHTARRTFATLAYLYSDLDIRDLMRFFGHKKESTFKRYVQVQKPIDPSKIINIFGYNSILKKVV